MESQTERSGKLDWFGCGVGLHLAENNRRCGVVGWPGRRQGSVLLRRAKQHCWMRRLEQAVLAALGEEDERLKKNVGRWM